MTETAVAQKLESLFDIVNGEVDFDAVEIDPQNEEMIDILLQVLSEKTEARQV